MAESSHTQLLTDARADIWHQKGKEAGEALLAAVGGLLLTDGRCLRRRQKIGVWISVAPSMVNVM